VKDRKAEIEPLRNLSASLRSGKPEDFDGRTEFYRLTPKQRLEWFEQDDDVPFMEVFQIRPEKALDCACCLSGGRISPFADRPCRHESSLRSSDL